jgi:hypothetical protein
MPLSYLPDASHATTMNSVWDDNIAYHFNEPQYPITFAEMSGDPSVSAQNPSLPELSLPITYPDTATILEILSAYLSIEEVCPITYYLQRYFPARPSRITGFRAGVVTLPNDKKRWPVIEWREDPDTDVLAIFNIMGPNVPCGCLKHYGDGVGWLERKRWRRSSLTWQVTEIEELRDLLVVAQHSLGTVHWSHEDVANLYMKDCPENCSNEQYFSTLLLAHY